MSRDRARRHSRLITGAASAALVLTSVLALQSSSADTLEERLAEDTRFPGQGLPGYAQDPDGEGYWVDPQATSLNYISSAKQWVSPPTFQAVANNLRTIDLYDPLCTGRLGEFTTRRDFRAPVVFVNTDVGAFNPARFGRTQTFTVRTVAFGSIPVEADIALEQPRNAQDAVLPAILGQRAATYCPGEGPYPSRPPGGGPGNTLLSQTSLEGAVAVQVAALRIDGVAIGPLRGCAAEDARMSLSAPDYYGWDPEPSLEERPTRGNELTTRFFNLGFGGLLTGHLDVPAFSRCTTPEGDDLSQLLTAAVSGDRNPVTVRSEGLPPDGGLGDNTPRESAEACVWNNDDCPVRLPQLDVPDAPPTS